MVSQLRTRKDIIPMTHNKQFLSILFYFWKCELQLPHFEYFKINSKSLHIFQDHYGSSMLKIFYCNKCMDQIFWNLTLYVQYIHTSIYMYQNPLGNITQILIKICVKDFTLVKSYLIFLKHPPFLKLTKIDA